MKRNKIIKDFKLNLKINEVMNEYNSMLNKVFPSIEIYKSACNAHPKASI